jgi:hypothetical protein
VIALWLRLEAGRRWRSLLVLALLVAFATATVLTSVAGARRGASAPDRLLARSYPATAVALPNQPGFDWGRVRALPEVAAMAQFPVSGFGVEGVPISAGPFPTVGNEVFRTIERPVVLQGRMLDPARVDEVMVSARFPSRYHKGVGDTVTLRLMSAAQARDPAFDPTSVGVLKGPRIRARIVGIIRSPWYTDQPGQEPGVVSSPALWTHYQQNLLGPQGYINALIRLRHGEADLPRFRADLARVTGRSDIDVWSITDKFRAPAEKVIRFESASLLACGLAALAASILLIGQSVARYAAGTVADLRVLRAIGMTPRRAVAVAGWGPVVAATAGSTLGFAAAVVASRWMPIGYASDLEPAPGVDIDWAVLGAGWAAAPLLVLAGAMGAAAFFLTRREGQSRRSTAALLASRIGLPVPIVVGTRFALEPGQGRSTVPVRPALIGAVTGVLGVLAAFTFAAGSQDAATHPARFGQVHQLEAFTGFNGQDFGPTRKITSTAARDRDVRAVDDTLISVAEIGRTSVTTYSFAPTGRGSFPVVLNKGRMAARPDEIVLTPGSAQAAHARVGDRVLASGGTRPVEMTVTGIGFVPVGPHNDYNDGGWITGQGHQRLYAGAHYGFKFHELLVVLRDGADQKAVAARLTAATGGAEFAPPEPINAIPMIKDVQQLPVLLAGFLALLAVGAVGHALATAVRRRRHDVAVLRALGMTRWQARWAVVTQATLLAVVGLAFGVPLGIALGRTLWRLLADIMPLAYVPPLALLALLLAAPLALLLANALAAWPGHTATRFRIGHVLRAE